MSFRTQETAQAYKDYQERGGLLSGCALCKSEPIKTFKFWKIIPNNFPYDKVAIVHHTLLPIRHVTDKDLTQDELAELQTLKSTYINDEYGFIIESTNKTKSIPSHFHLHLIVEKK